MKREVRYYPSFPKSGGSGRNRLSREREREKKIGTSPRRETRDRVTRSRWSVGTRAITYSPIGELTTNHRWGNRLPGRRNGTQS